MFYKLTEEPSTMPRELLDHLKYREIYKVNRQHFSQKFTPILNGHYDFVVMPKLHLLVSIVYPLLIFAIIFVLRLSTYKIKRTPPGSVVTTRVMLKARTTARKAAKARLLTRRKRRAVDFRSKDTSLGAALRPINADTRTADESDTGDGALIVFVERITVKDETTVAGASSVEDTNALVEPSSPDATIHSSDSDSASGADKADLEVANAMETAISTDLLAANELNTDGETVPVAGAAKTTASEPGFSNNIESTVESLVDPILEAVVEIPEISRTNEATESGTGVEQSPSLSAFPKLDLTKGLQSADPDSSDREGILSALSTDSPATAIDTKPKKPDRNHLPHVGVEPNDSVASDPSITVEKFPDLDADAAPAILDAAVLLSPSLPVEPNAPVTSPRRRFVRPNITVPKTETSIEAVSRLAVMPEKITPKPEEEDEARISQEPTADMASISEPDASIGKVSGPAASKVKISSTRTIGNGEGTKRRSTMAASLESSGTTTKEDEKITKRRSTMAVKPEEGTKWPTFNIIPSNPNTASWPKSPWTLERMRDRKSLQGRTSECESHSPRTSSELRPQGFNLTPRSAPQSHSADTMPPLPTPFELRRASIYGQRPKISSDTPLTSAVASPLSRRLSSTGFPATPRSAPLPQSPLRKNIPPSSPNHFDTRRPSILGPRPRFSISILQSTQETVPVPPDKVPTASSNISGDRTASPTVG